MHFRHQLCQLFNLVLFRPSTLPFATQSLSFQKKFLSYFFFFLYACLGCWLIARIKFIRDAGLKPITVRVLFLIKILAGIALGWISVHFYGSQASDNDYWLMNEDGWKEYQLLLHHPKEYFSNIFLPSQYNHAYSGFFGSFKSYWNDLKNNIIAKIISVFDIFSQGNYYINSLFINFIGFFAHIALFRVFSNIYKGKNTALIIGCFLLPSCLYFSSGLHKDAIVFIALELFCFALYFSVNQKFTLKRIIVLVICSIVLVLIRSYVIILIVPAALAYILSVKRKWPALLTFISVYLIAGIAFFTINKIVPAIDPPGILIQKQQDFAAGLLLSNNGPAKTAVPTEQLEPTFKSFAHNVPPALNHTLLRPYLTEQQSKAQLPLAVELFLYQLLWIIAIFYIFQKQLFKINPFILFGFFLTLSIYLNVGFIISNLGSIVRYRSLYLPFLIVPALAVFNFRKTDSLF